MSQANFEQDTLAIPGLVDDEPEEEASGSPNRRRGRTIIIISSILVILLLGGILLTTLGGQKQRVVYQTQRVTQGNFALSVNATGPLQANVYDLNFTGTGKLSEVDVQVGQTVKLGQTLGKLDPTSLQNTVNESQATVAASQTALGNAQNNYAATTGASQASVSSSQIALSNAQSNYAAAAKASQASVDAAQTTLNNAVSSLSQTQTQTSASIAAAQTTLDNARTNYNKVQAQTQQAVDAAKSSLNDAQTNLDKVKAQTQAQLQVAYDQEQQAINTCNTETSPPPNCVATAQDTYAQAQANAAAQVATAQNQVNTAQNSLSTAQAQQAAQNATAQGQVTSAQSALNTAQAQGGTSIATAQNQVSSAQKQLAQSQAQANSQNTTAQGQVSAAEKQLAQAEAQANSQDVTAQGQINTAQGQLASSQTQLSSAQYNVSNTLLVAPHDGTVVAVNGMVGGTPGVSGSSTTGTGNIFVQLVDLSTLQVQASVNESDIGGVAVGDSVQFSVSAYGSRVFTGKVSAISPLGQSVSNVVSYPVLINVDTQDSASTHLLPGMTANATINTLTRQNVLTISASALSFANSATTVGNPLPGRSLITAQQAKDALAQANQLMQTLQQNGTDYSKDNPAPAYILIQKGSTITAQPIVVGLNNGQVYEVLAGLTANETIITGAQVQSVRGFAIGRLFGGARGGAGGTRNGGTNGSNGG